ncbi:hypothetical protein ACC739_37400, partial [Rhizobium ruizarguesonis]
IEFQRKYLSMESAKAFSAFSFHFGAEGISIKGEKIACPSLVICSINDEAGNVQGGAFESVCRISSGTIFLCRS